MLIVHKPYTVVGLRGQREPVVYDPEKKDPRGSSYKPLRLMTARGGHYLTVGHSSYRLSRGVSEWVRVLPEEQEVEYRRLTAEIARLQQERQAVVEEGWGRAKPYRHVECSCGDPTNANVEHGASCSPKDSAS